MFLKLFWFLYYLVYVSFLFFSLFHYCLSIANESTNICFYVLFLLINCSLDYILLSNLNSAIRVCFYYFQHSILSDTININSNILASYKDHPQ